MAEVPPTSAGTFLWGARKHVHGGAGPGRMNTRWKQANLGSIYMYLYIITGLFKLLILGIYFVEDWSRLRLLFRGPMARFQLNLDFAELKEVTKPKPSNICAEGNPGQCRWLGRVGLTVLRSLHGQAKVIAGCEKYILGSGYLNMI